MSAIRSKNTKPEILVRRLLFAKGERFKTHYGLYKIDIAFPASKVAVFVDGCFWHGCPWHYQAPSSNVDYWKRKVIANTSRDAKKNRELRKSGWKVIRIWEHSIESRPNHVVKRIRDRLHLADIGGHQ